MRYLYTFLFYLFLPFIFIRLLFKSRRQPAYRQRLLERFGFYPVNLKNSIWVHAVSVGESIAAIPLIKSLQNRYPQMPVVVSTTTPTGAERIISSLGKTVTHVYLPYDLPGAMHRLLRKLNPAICIIMETELWPNLLFACQQKKIPVCLANARMSEKSARGYQRIATLSKQMLHQLSLIATHAAADAQRFLALGAIAERVKVAGSIKFDLCLPDQLQEKILALKTQLGERMIWIAASTHEGEEEIILEAQQKLLQKYPHLLLILVPRHPNRFDNIANQIQQNFSMARRSLNQNITQETSVYLGDTMGELLLLYGVADIAFVGGSLIPRGGHNILEPAALGKPILTGESVFNFTEICQLFQTEKAMIKIQDAQTLADKIDWLIQHPEEQKQMGERALNVINKNRGALAKQIKMLCDVIDGGKV